MTEPTTSTVIEFDFVDELERMLPEMRAFARSLARDAELADDLVQDTYLKAWGAMDSFRPGAAMRPWLFQILRNQYLQHTRRAWRSTELEPEQAERTLVSSECLESKSDFKILQTVLETLPPQQRDALILVAAAGFTYEEAGEIFGCSDGTVKSRVSRAREAAIHSMARADSGKTRRVPHGQTRSTPKTLGLDNMLAHIDELKMAMPDKAA